MQKQSPETVRTHGPIEVAVAILAVPGERSTELHGMDTNLVSAPRTRIRGDQARNLSRLDGNEVG